MVGKATEFEALRVFHNLWKKGQMDATQVRHLLETEYFLKLTVLANGEIKAESFDGEKKYTINQ